MTVELFLLHRVFLSPTLSFQMVQLFSSPRLDLTECGNLNTKVQVSRYVSYEFF